MTLSKRKNGVFGKIILGVVFAFLFAPIAVLIFFSFNPGSSTTVFDFSPQSSPANYFYWYQELLRDEATLTALKNTLLLAVSASVIATLLGTAAAYGLSRLRSRRLRETILGVTQIPLMNPDIITGISFTLLFVFVAGLLHFQEALGFPTMLIAHVTFCLPYVILEVLPKFDAMDPSLPEAALDLGCTPLASFFRVELPEILPGVFTGMLMAFTLSLDDFVISYFTQGSGFETLPIHIYAMTKKAVKPKIYALATLIFLVILALLLLLNHMSRKEEKKERAEE